MSTPSIESLMSLAEGAEAYLSPSRNNKYLPIIRTLSEKNYTTAQIGEWLQDKGVNISNQFIGKHRRIHRETLGMVDEPEEQEDGEQEKAPEQEKVTRPLVEPSVQQAETLERTPSFAEQVLAARETPEPHDSDIQVGMGG